MEENRVKKILFDEVSFVIATVSLVSGFIFWVTNPAQVLSERVSTLENSLEFQTQLLSDIKSKVDVIESRQIEVLKAVARLEVKE